jgi:hypothetical protein
MTAGIYSGLNDKDEAFRLLEKAYEQRLPDMQYLGIDPLFYGIRSDPAILTCSTEWDCRNLSDYPALLTCDAYLYCGYRNPKDSPLGVVSCCIS